MPLQHPEAHNHLGYRVELAGNDGAYSLSRATFWITWFIISYRAFCWSYNAVTLALITHVAVNEQPLVPTGDSAAKRQFSPDLAGGSGGLTLPSLPPYHTISLGQIRESRRVDPHSRGGRCRIGIPRRTE